MNYKENEVNYGTCGKYSFGGVGFSMTNMLILTYLTFFCTDIFGISSMTVAGLMLITQIIDAVTDPLMGLIADHTRTKWGRYRPYLMFGAPVLGICIYLLFSAPELSQTMKIVFIYVAYIAYTLAFTPLCQVHDKKIFIISYPHDPAFLIGVLPPPVSVRRQKTHEVAPFVPAAYTQKLCRRFCNKTQFA